MTDFVEPIKFPHSAAAAKFCQINRCKICRGHLIVDQIDSTSLTGGDYGAWCGICRQWATDTNHIHEAAIREIEHNERMTRQDLELLKYDAGIKKPRSESEILKDLGF